jgi:adenylate cyclase
MDPYNSDSLHFLTVDQKIAHLNGLTEQMQSYFLKSRLASISDNLYNAVFQIRSNLNDIRQSTKALELERKGLYSLFQISQYINSSLDPDEVLRIAMDIIINLTQAERGFLMLAEDRVHLSIRIARNWEQESLSSNEWVVSRTVINRVTKTKEPIITTDALEDPRFNTQDSIEANQIRSILCVPLLLKGELVGVIYTDHRVRRGVFTSKERDLLVDFANQAAVAIENARLYASIRKSLAEVKELKDFTDNVITSIASGVWTIDNSDRIVLINRAAEDILRVRKKEVAGCSLSDIFPELARFLQPQITFLRRTGKTILGITFSHIDPVRGRLELRFNLSLLSDSQRKVQGIVIIVDDLTEIRNLEAQRRLFERMVSPAVIDMLDPNKMQLGGKRSEITILFSDLRGFTQLSEMIEPEDLVTVLNQYLAAAAEAVMAEGGTVDKFLGDAVMAWFNAPVQQDDHTMCAIRTALAIQSITSNLHHKLPDTYRLSFGTGIHTGEAILGLIGTEKRSDYTAIGDCVNSAKRIQESAGPGKILLSEQAYRLVAGRVNVELVEPVMAKGKREPITVYELLGLLDDEASHRMYPIHDEPN